MKEIIYPLPLGTRLKSQNEYTIIKALGQGGFGITYIATADVKIGNVVAKNALFAIKEFFLLGKCKRADDGISLIPMDKSLSDEVQESLQDFITEGKRINKLCRADEHIVDVNEVFTANNTAYFVMEYLDAGSVYELVERRGKLSASDAKGIIIPIAEAIGKMHEENVLHLDIKPENIMMKKASGGKLCPVIIDFGISMHFNKQGKPTTQSKNKSISEGYSPIEQYGKIDSFMPKVDVYALGATVLYMLTGKEPRQAFDVTTEYLDQMLGGIDETIADAVKHAMSREVATRTTSVEEFVKELTTPKQADGRKKTEKLNIDHQDENTPKKSSFIRGNIKLVCGALLAGALVAGTVIFVPKGCPGSPTVVVKNDSIDSVVAQKDSLVAEPETKPLKHVVDMLIKLPDGSEYKYTGDLVDTLGALPNGKGEATFEKDGTTYEGNFVNGICEDTTGKATLTYESGDKYTGTFKGGNFDEGRYDYVAEKCYFVGTFKDGNPYNGTWYNDDGSLSAHVVNGVEKL